MLCSSDGSRRRVSCFAGRSPPAWGCSFPWTLRRSPGFPGRCDLRLERMKVDERRTPAIAITSRRACYIAFISSAVVLLRVVRSAATCLIAFITVRILRPLETLPRQFPTCRIRYISPLHCSIPPPLHGATRTVILGSSSRCHLHCRFGKLLGSPLDRRWAAHRRLY